MSLQAPLTLIPSGSCGSVLSSRTESSAHSFARGRMVSLSKQIFGSSDVSCSKGLRLSASTRAMRTRRWQSTALMAAAADSGPSNGDAAGASDGGVNLPLAWSSREDFRPFFVSFLLGVHERLRDLRARGLLQGAREGLREARSWLRNADGRVVLEDISRSKILGRGACLWQSLEPSIKWPLAICAVAYLLVLGTWGMQVAQELIPLWILGPLVFGLFIRSANSVGDLAQKSFAKSEPLRQAASGLTLQVYDEAKKGELVEKLRATIESKSRNLREEALQKRSDFTVYVRSGEAVQDFRFFLLGKLTQLNGWRIETYEDMAEWARPSWRAFSRLMRKLF